MRKLGGRRDKGMGVPGLGLILATVTSLWLYCHGFVRMQG